MGKMPVERSEEQKEKKKTTLLAQINKAVEIIMSNTGNDFLALNSLNDVIDQLPKNRIGDEMRSYFKQVFSEFLKYEEMDEITSMEAFWRS